MERDGARQHVFEVGSIAEKLEQTPERLSPSLIKPRAPTCFLHKANTPFLRNQGPVKNRKCFRACPSLRKKYRCLRRVKQCYSRERLLSTQSHLTPKRPSNCQALRIHRRTQSRVLKMGNGIHLYHQPQQLPAPFPARVNSDWLFEEIEIVFHVAQEESATSS